jgi:RNA polymerase sigma-70 factor (ECF subfamily)
MSDVERIVERAYRESSGPIRARLVRTLRDFELAEEIVHEAFAAALVQWPSQGLPNDPGAWLMRTAQNKAIDLIRHRAGAADKLAALAQFAQDLEEAGEAELAVDDMLRLIFTCCHPAISPEGQVALTLQTVCGLRSEEIARAFLVSPITMNQRLVRAKRKIKDAGIPYAVPEAAMLPSRVSAACTTVYLVFNEGYAATAGAELVRAELCVEAIRLGRLLDALLPARADVEGLLALMLLIDARRATRVDAEGVPVLLEDQDRSLWHASQIAEGAELVRRSLGHGPTSFGVQAAIAALHAQAPSSAATDWPQIVGLYDRLALLQKGPVVSLNRAAAVTMAEGPEAALRLLDALERSGALSEYHLFHAARADVLRRLGRYDAALGAYRRALELVSNEPERRFLEQRIARLGAN